VSTVLVVVPPLTGHVNPTIALGAELTRRGHDVAWAGLPGVVDELLPPGAAFVPVVGAFGRDELTRLQATSRGLRGPEALKFLWEDFIVPYARATAGELLAAVERLAPDVLVVDQQAVAGAVVARLTGTAWVTSATTSAELTDPLAGLPRVDAWVRRQLVDLQVELGVDPARAAEGDLRFSDRLVVAFTTRALCTPAPGLDDRVRFVGPALGPRPAGADFPWDWLDDRPGVLVSLGTVNAADGGRFFATAVEALAGEPLQAVLVAPEAIARLVPDHVDNILVAERVPQLALLPHLAAVVSHGGHNTVCEALAHGLPLVLAPIRDDQPIVAEQVVQAGAGRRVRYGRVRPAELREAVHAAVSDPELRRGAEIVRESFARAGGAPDAAAAVEGLMCGVTP
jgi:MGT family glycosyltransferase